MPVPGNTTTTSPTFTKRIYDLIGIIISISLMNYAAGPFMLSTIEKSFESFSRIAWYGYILVFAGLVFFYAGGSMVLKSMQASRVKKAESRQNAAEKMSRE